MLTHAKHVVLTILFAMAATSVAHAQAPNKKQLKRAAQLIRKANKSKKAGDRFAKKPKTKAKAMARYKAAARGYLDAFAIAEAPKIIFRLAEIYRARGETAWALRGYYRYIELEPMGEHSDACETFIADITDKLSADEPTSGDADIDPTDIFGLPPPPIVDVAQDKPEVTPKKPPTPKPVPVTAKKEVTSSSSPGRVFRISGIGTAIVGAAVLGLGIKFGLDSRSASDDLSSKTGPWTEEDKKRISDGESAESKALLFSLLGTAGIIGGGVLYYIGSGRSKRKETQSRLVPVIQADGASLTWLGSF